ncbi:MAG: phosphoribosylglycinamide formyltransferase [Firmicutes bacterium]|nr:phosphoribosylglycinamide formyltransferase [Bacillota bacterium]
MGRLAILISGRGSNLQALIDAIERGILDAEIAVVISDRPDILGLARAEKAGIRTRVLPWQGDEHRESYFEAMAQVLHDEKIDLIVLAGFMRVLSRNIIREFPNKIINIHPSLLPAFSGMRAQRQALKYGVKLAGCTVHFVDEGVDTGPILIQRAVPVYSHDTEDTLAQRILAEEHVALPEAVQMVLAGNWRIQGRRVICEH